MLWQSLFHRGFIEIRKWQAVGGAARVRPSGKGRTIRKGRHVLNHSSQCAIYHAFSVSQVSKLKRERRHTH